MEESKAVLHYPMDNHILRTPAKQREPLQHFLGNNLKKKNNEIIPMGKSELYWPSLCVFYKLVLLLF